MNIGNTLVILIQTYIVHMAELNSPQHLPQNLSDGILFDS